MTAASAAVCYHIPNHHYRCMMMTDDDWRLLYTCLSVYTINASGFFVHIVEPSLTRGSGASLFLLLCGAQISYRSAKVLLDPSIKSVKASETDMLCCIVSVRETYLSSHHHHHFWQAPLRVRSAKRRHQSPKWTVLSQVNCVVHIEVAGFQILLNGFHLCDTRTSQWSLPVSCGASC